MIEPRLTLRQVYFSRDRRGAARRAGVSGAYLVMM